MNNNARGASNLQTEWNHVLRSYRDSKDPVDVVLIDYLMTAYDYRGSMTAVKLLHKFLESWERPPAVVFVETIPSFEMDTMVQDPRPCDYVKEMDTCLFLQKEKIVRVP